MGEELAVVAALDVDHLAALDVLVAAIEKVEIDAEGLFADLGEHGSLHQRAADALLFDDYGRMVVYVPLNIVEGLAGAAEDFGKSGRFIVGLVSGARFRDVGM